MIGHGWRRILWGCYTSFWFCAWLAAYKSMQRLMAKNEQPEEEKQK